jgi:hypothetical protein
MPPQTQALDFIPRTEKKPVELQATCQPLPCDSAVLRCQEEPQVSSVFWCALQGSLQLTSLDTSFTPGSTPQQCVRVCMCRNPIWADLRVPVPSPQTFHTNLSPLLSCVLCLTHQNINTIMKHFHPFTVYLAFDCNWK